MELALKGHRRLRSSRKLKLGWRRPKLDLVKIVRANRVRQEQEQRAHAIWKASTTGRILPPYIL